MNPLVSFLTTIAPTLASALLGPMAGIAVAGLSKIFGLSEASQENVASMINDGKLTPEHLAAIKELELQYKNDEAERGFKYKELEFKDVADARGMQKETKSVIPATLTILVTCGFFGVLGWMMYEPSVVNSPPLLIMLGQLSAGWAAVISFWMGTTSGSSRTRELLAQLSPPK